jgi:two-component system sensor histidine kinase QseC
MSLLLILGAAVVYATTRSALTRQFDDSLRSKTMAVASIVEQDKGTIDVDSSDDIIHEFDSTKSGAFFQVWRGDGSVAAVSPSLRGSTLPLPAANSGLQTCWNFKFPSGLAVRAAGLTFKPHPANDDNQTNAQLAAILVVAADRHNLDQALATLGIILTGSSLLVLILTGLMVSALLRRELSPLEQLGNQVQSINAESLSSRLVTEGLPSEVAPISLRINDLLQRLQSAFARERQFSDDLAHELRTPIAELRSLTEVALKWPENRASDSDRNTLAIALQMEKIVNRLLAIARSDKGLADLEMQPLELKSVISMVCGSLEGRSAGRQLFFQMSFPNALEIESDPTLLRLIFNNLLENAVEYSKPGTAVAITGASQNGQFTLNITNSVQQLHAGDIPYLFERFWRKDAARSGGDHAGLGLSLSRALATSLGYALTASLDDKARLTMQLSGPTKAIHRSQPI